MMPAQKTSLSSEKAVSEYQYSPQEIEFILKKRLEHQREAKQKDQTETKIHALDSKNSEELNNLLLGCRDIRTNTNILIAYKIADTHWIGISLNINNGELSYARILSALIPDASQEIKKIEYTIVNALKNSIAQIFVLREIKYGYIQKINSEDSIVYTIENLTYSAENLNPTNSPSIKDLRTTYNSYLQDVKIENMPSIAHESSIANGSFLVGSTVNNGDVKKIQHDVSNPNEEQRRKATEHKKNNTMPIPTNDSSVNASSEYQYSPLEIELLIKKRLNDHNIDIEREDQNVSKTQIYVFDYKSLEELQAFLLKCSADNHKHKKFLIAYKIADFHWIGISLKSSNGRLYSATILTALHSSASQESKRIEIEVAKAIIGAINRIYNFNETNYAYIQEPKVTDSVVYTIENLAYSIANHLKITNPPSAKDLRIKYKLHLQAARLKSNTTSNSSSRNIEEEEKKTPEKSAQEPTQPELPAKDPRLVQLDADIKKLIENANILDTQITEYLSVEAKAVNSLSLQSEEQFATIFDPTTNKLSVQINALAQTLPGVQYILQKKYTNSYFYSAFKGFAGGGLIGGAGGAATSLVIEGEIFFTASTFAGEGLGLAGAAVPWIFIPGILFAAGFGTRKYLQYKFYDAIFNAHHAYSKCNDVEDIIFTKAFNALNNELKRNGASSFIRDTGKSDVLNYSKILKAKLQRRQGHQECLSTLDEIISNTKNRNIRHACLVEKLSIYTDTDVQIKGKNNANISKQQRQREVDLVSAELDRNNPEIVMHYFKRVLQLYKCMHSSLNNNTLDKSTDLFEHDRIQLAHFYSLTELEYLRHFSPHGRVAEIAFTFMQGIAHEACALHHAGLFYVNNIIEHKHEMIRSNELAESKYSNCLNLIKDCRFDEITEEQDSLLFGIVQSISSTTDPFLRKRNEAKATDSQTHKTLEKNASKTQIFSELTHVGQNSYLDNSTHKESQEEKESVKARLRWAEL